MYFDTKISIACASQAQINKVRAWARKNGASVSVHQYTRGYYEGYVAIPNRWNRGRDAEIALAADCRALLSA